VADTVNGSAGASGPLLDRVVSLLRSLEWVVDADPDYPGGMHLSPSDGDAPWPLAVVVEDDGRRVVVYSVLPEDVPVERRADVLQVANLANLRLDTATVDLDPDDGEVRVRSALAIGEVDLHDDQLAGLLRELLAGNLEAASEWLDNVAAVVEGAGTS